MVLVGGINTLVFVGLGEAGAFVGDTVAGGLVVGVEGMGVTFTDVGMGVPVSKDAPGVRNISIHAGWVRMAESRGSKNPFGWELMKSLFGSRRDPMLVFSLQLGAKRSAHPLVSRMHRNPNRRMRRMMSQSRLSRLSFSRAVMGMSTDGQLHKDLCAGVRYFIMTGAFKPDASMVCIYNAACDGKSQPGTSAFEFGFAGGM